MVLKLIIPKQVAICDTRLAVLYYTLTLAVLIGLGLKRLVFESPHVIIPRSTQLRMQWNAPESTKGMESYSLKDDICQPQIRLDEMRGIVIRDETLPNRTRTKVDHWTHPKWRDDIVVCASLCPLVDAFYHSETACFAGFATASFDRSAFALNHLLDSRDANTLFVRTSRRSYVTSVRGQF